MTTVQTLSTTRDSRPLRALLRARRRQRGVMLIETLFVLLTMGVFLGCSLAFHSFYATKAETIAVARLEAWKPALAGCRMEATDKLLERSAEHSARAFGNGTVRHSWLLSTQTIVTCNDPPAGDEVNLGQTLDSLYQLLPWRPVDMMRWFFGSELFSGMLGPLQGLGSFLHLAVEEVSNPRKPLLDRLGDVLALTEQALGGAFDWVASVF